MAAECAKAEAAIIELRKELMNGDGIASLEVVDRLAVCFVTLLEGSQSLSEVVKTRINSVLVDLNSFSEKQAISRDAERSRAKRLASLRDYHGTIVKIRVELQGDVS